MKYYKYQDEESEIADAITYIETENGAELRRITYNGALYVASNVIQPDGHMNLADTWMDYDEFADEITAITKQEFDEIWDAYLVTRQTEWNLIKQNY